MRLNLDMNILRHMTDGVLVLDRYAQVVAFNKIAEPWASRCQAMSAALKRLIDDERSGRLILPLFIDMKLEQSNTSAQHADAWLCKNGRNEYAIFIVSANLVGPVKAATAAQRRGKRNLMALIGGEVREQLSILRGLMHESGRKQQVAPDAFEQQCRKVEQLMREVTDLSQLLEHDEVFAGERLSVPDLIENILVSLPANNNLPAIELHTGADPLGSVYGNRAWLAYAMRLLIDGLIDGTPPRTTCQVATRQRGDLLIVTGQSVSSPVGQGDPLLTQTGTVEPGIPDEETTNLPMLMCKRIVELHEGQLKLTSTPTGLASFTLILMTKVPADERDHASCGDCRYASRALSFASDMAQLIASTQTTISDRSL